MLVEESGNKKLDLLKSGQTFLGPGDSCYVKPFTLHNFRGTGKLLILRIGGKLTGDSQRELSLMW